MHREEAVARLPRPYARAMRLRDAGADDSAIAADLDIALDAVGALLAIGDRKLASLLAIESVVPVADEGPST